MTEKLTYDPTPADSTEFSKDEQDSLKVAERLGAEESKQYAGKFDSPEDLENAYIELQKKLGSPDEDTEVDTLRTEDLDPGTQAGVSLITDASNEYYANDGSLSQETMSKFSEMSTTDLVNAYVEMQKANPTQGSAPSKDLTDADINTVFNSAGGEAEYKKLTSWASDNLDNKKLGAFNSIVNNGDATAIQIAVAGLRSEYESQEGYEGRMLSGKAARTLDGFRSQAELVEAMKDPRYANDEAYQQDVYNKLERSNVQF